MWNDSKQPNMQNSAAAMQSSAPPPVVAAVAFTSSHGNNAVYGKEFFQSFPAGYRFAPLDSELIIYYLERKIRGQPLPPNRIAEVNLYQKDPFELTKENEPLNETEWYFFTSRDKKYAGGSRPNRATPNGYWKPTGTDKAIMGPEHGQPVIGYKKTLDFYQGSHPNGRKTDWKMHEYKIEDDSSKSSSALVRAKAKGKAHAKPIDTHTMVLDKWVLCKIYNKRKETKSGDDDGENEVVVEESNSTMVNGEDDHNSAISQLVFGEGDINAGSSPSIIMADTSSSALMVGDNGMNMFEVDDNNYNNAEFLHQPSMGGGGLYRQSSFGIYSMMDSTQFNPFSSNGSLPNPFSSFGEGFGDYLNDHDQNDLNDHDHDQNDLSYHDQNNPDQRSTEKK